MTNSEYYGILGLIRKKQSEYLIFESLPVIIMIVLAVFPAMILFVDVFLFSNVVVERVAFVALIAGLLTTVLTFFSNRSTSERKTDLVGLLNKSRSLPAEKVEKMEEFKDLFE